jgi:putative membrane protein
MWQSSLLASFHYLALPLGLGGLFMRGRALRSLEKKGADPETFERLYASDNCWGVAALLWLLTGLTRAFGGFEKGTEYYLGSPLFWVKMALFGAVALLEILPMVTFIRWRIARKKERALPGFGSLSRLRWINDLETALVILIPFAASAMARGIGS